VVSLDQLREKHFGKSYFLIIWAVGTCLWIITLWNFPCYCI